MPLLPSALPPKGEARRYVANDLLNLIAFLIGEGGPRQRRSGTFVNGALEMIFPALCHPASALSAPTGHLPLEGKALSVSHMRVFVLTLLGKQFSRIVSLPLEGKVPRRGG